MCTACEAYHGRPDHAEMHEVEVPPTPMQVIDVDLIGPFACDEYCRRHLLTAIDYRKQVGRGDSNERLER